MYPCDDCFWGRALASVLEDCCTTRPWLFLSWSSVTPCRFAISVQKMWKTLEHAVSQNISKRANLSSIAQWPPSLRYHFQIRRKSLTVVEFAVPCVAHSSTVLVRKRGQSGNFHIWSGWRRGGEKKTFSKLFPWIGRDIYLSGFQVHLKWSSMGLFHLVVRYYSRFPSMKVVYWMQKLFNVFIIICVLNSFHWY